MARTNSAAVQGVLLNDYDSAEAPSLTPFIDTASIIVDRIATCATKKGITLTGSELELIERWLAAHFYGVSDQPYTASRTLDAYGQFQGRTNMYLEATKYGQMAMVLDNSGCLAAIGTEVRKRASMAWLGKTKTEQIPYEQRD